MPSSSANSLVRLYALADAEPSAEGLSASPWRGLWAVFDRPAASDFEEERLKDLATLAEMAQAHDATMSALLEAGSVLPFKFGTLFRSEAKMEEALSAKEGYFAKRMEAVKGRAEWGVKAFADVKAFAKALEAAPELSALREQAEGATPGAAFFVRKKLEAKRDELLEAKLRQALAEIESELSARSAESRTLAMQTAHFDEPVGKLAFLVEKADSEAFAAEIEALNVRLAPLGLSLNLNGPWAPYSFA